MNAKTILMKLGYLLIAVLISTFLIYQINNGFRKQDLITIAVVSLILYLLFDIYFNRRSNEGFNIENFATQYPDTIANTIPSSEFTTVEPILPDINNDNTLPDPNIGEQIEVQEEIIEDQPLIMEEELKKVIPQINLNKVDEEGKIFDIQDITPKQFKKFQDQKFRQVTKKQSGKPDINNHRMSDGKELMNNNEYSMLPININVSYNNNKPTNVNDFDGKSGGDKPRKSRKSSRMIVEDTIRNIPDKEEKKDSNQMWTRASPTNSVTENAALSKMNQSYYPAYLQNPLNKNQPGTKIASIFAENEEIKNKLQKERVDRMTDNPAALQRNDQANLQNNENWMASNYEATMLKKILNERNDPAPVLLENPWSEWAPAN